VLPSHRGSPSNKPQPPPPSTKTSEFPYTSHLQFARSSHAGKIACSQKISASLPADRTPQMVTQGAERTHDRRQAARTITLAICTATLAPMAAKACLNDMSQILHLFRLVLIKIAGFTVHDRSLPSSGRIRRITTLRVWRERDWKELGSGCSLLSSSICLVLSISSADYSPSGVLIWFEHDCRYAISASRCSCSSTAACLDYHLLISGTRDVRHAIGDGLVYGKGFQKSGGLGLCHMKKRASSSLS